MEQTSKEKSVFETLNAINVGSRTKKKGQLTYLSWVWAWTEVKKLYPDANFTIYKSPNGVNYFTDGRTAWVEVGVTINGLEHVEQLAIMANNNQSMSLQSITSTVVNKAIKRALTKACALHGLGLYIYAGEDLPEGEKKNAQPSAQPLEIANMLDNAITEVLNAKTHADAVAVWQRHAEFHDCPSFAAITQRVCTELVAKESRHG